jgi:hypothetical protein
MGKFIQNMRTALLILTIFAPAVFIPNVFPQPIEDFRAASMRGTAYAVRAACGKTAAVYRAEIHPLLLAAITNGAEIAAAHTSKLGDFTRAAMSAGRQELANLRDECVPKLESALETLSRLACDKFDITSNFLACPPRVAKVVEASNETAVEMATPIEIFFESEKQASVETQRFVSGRDVNVAILTMMQFILAFVLVIHILATHIFNTSPHTMLLGGAAHLLGSRGALYMAIDSLVDTLECIDHAIMFRLERVASSITEQYIDILPEIGLF